MWAAAHLKHKEISAAAVSPFHPVTATSPRFEGFGT
jgi:hypothetical protein